jgi:hypothetical protein
MPGHSGEKQSMRWSGTICGGTGHGSFIGFVNHHIAVLECHTDTLSSAALAFAYTLEGQAILIGKMTERRSAQLDVSIRSS